MPSSTVCPSRGALATRSLPIVPDAPGLFSTTTVCRHDSCSLVATRRASVSVAPPAGYGTMRRSGWLGYVDTSCANAPALAVIATATASARRMYEVLIACLRWVQGQPLNRLETARLRGRNGASSQRHWPKRSGSVEADVLPLDELGVGLALDRGLALDLLRRPRERLEREGVETRLHLRIGEDFLHVGVDLVAHCGRQPARGHQDDERAHLEAGRTASLGHG